MDRLYRICKMHHLIIPFDVQVSISNSNNYLIYAFYTHHFPKMFVPCF